MKKVEVNVGDKYGMLTIIKFHHEKTRYYERKDASYRKPRLAKRTYRYYECKCDCGNTCIVELTHLRSGHTKSCGCYRDYINSQPSSKKSIHGVSGHPLYGTWCKMRARCLSEKDANYKNYGGRGIKICDEWKDSPKVFIEWSENNGWSEGCGLSLDRIDVNGDYSPSNCRWATTYIQNNNRRNNRYVTYNGETHTIKEWSDLTGISTQALAYRLNNPKWTLDEVFNTKFNGSWSCKHNEDYNLAEIYNEEQEDKLKKLKHIQELCEADEVKPREGITYDTNFEYNGVTHTIREWAEFMGFAPKVLLRRLKLGWAMKDALFLSPRRRDKGTN